MTLNEIELLYHTQPTPSIILRTDAPHFTIASANPAFLEVTQTTSAQLVGKRLFEAFPIPSDVTGSKRQGITEGLEYVMLFKRPYQIQNYKYDPRSENSNTHYWRIETYPLLNEDREIQYIVQSLIDITTVPAEVLTALYFTNTDKYTKESTSPAQQQEFFNFSQAPLERLEKQVLELNSKKETPISEVLSAYAKGIEMLFPNMLCSIMQVKNNRLYNWAAPSLPEPYNMAMEGLPTGPHVGSCGAAAFLKQQVIVSDIANDERWTDYKAIALEFGLKACWSYPVLNSDDEVMATFGIYYNEIKTPNEAELKIIERAAALLKVILENRQYAAILEENSLLMAQGQELAHFGNWSWDIPNNQVTWSDVLFDIYGLNKHEFKATFEGYQELLHPDDREMVYNAIQDVLKTGLDSEFEERIIRPDGEIKHLKSWGTLKRDENGAPVKMVGACLDITQSKKTQGDLLRSKRLYSDLFHLSPQPMWVYELSTLKFLDVNEAATLNYGYSREEFLQMSLRDIRPKEDIDALNDIVEHDIKNGVVHSITCRHRKKSGEIILVNARGNSIIYNGISARIVVALDNTDKLSAEEKLMTSERRFKTLIQDGGDLMAIVDVHGIYQYVSPNAERVLSEKSENLIGKTAFSFIYRADRDSIISEFSKLDRQKRVELSPYRFINGKREIRWAETVLTDMRDDPAIGGIIVNSRDVTHRMEHELQIKDHLDRYNIVSKATSDAIWDLNMATGKVIWNQGIRGIFGHQEIIQNQQWWHNHVHPDDIQQVTNEIARHIAHKQSRWTCEYRFRSADGTYKFVLDRGFLIFDHNAQPVRMIGAMQDITDRINYIHAIEQHNHKLREISWAQSHLVRAPLARIMGIIELLNHPDTDTETLQTLLSYLNTSAMELDEIVKDTIAKSQVPETGS